METYNKMYSGSNNTINRGTPIERDLRKTKRGDVVYTNRYCGYLEELGIECVFYTLQYINKDYPLYKFEEVLVARSGFNARQAFYYLNDKVVRPEEDIKAILEEAGLIMINNNVKSFNLEYENFVRGAFGDVKKGEDPAHLADQDCISNNSFSLNRVKAAVIYSIAAYNSKYTGDNYLDGDDIEKMNDFLVEAFAVNSFSELHGLINVYCGCKNNWDQRIENRNKLKNNRF